MGARADGQLVASIFATRWGDFTWLGPLSVLPHLWNGGIAQRLLDHVIPDLNSHSRHLALYTVAESAKHVGLYRRYGFWPGYLTLVMEKPVKSGEDHAGYSTFRETNGEGRDRFLDRCRAVADSLFAGLDLSAEIWSAELQCLGETILLSDSNGPSGFAIVHLGAGTEAGGDTAYVKSAMIRPGPRAGNAFDRLLLACEHLSAERGMKRLVAGVNTARRGAYSGMLDRGFRSIMQGVAMHRPDDPAYDRPDAYAIDDWR